MCILYWKEQPVPVFCVRFFGDVLSSLLGEDLLLFGSILGSLFCDVSTKTLAYVNSCYIYFAYNRKEKTVENVHMYTARKELLLNSSAPVGVAVQAFINIRLSEQYSKTC